MIIMIQMVEVYRTTLSSLYQAARHAGSEIDRTGRRQRQRKWHIYSSTSKQASKQEVACMHKRIVMSTIPAPHAMLRLRFLTSYHVN
jgi:long-subunit acyl-CoA synthetase (AMP-forming)